MDWLGHIRERHLRIAAVVLIFAAFIKMNWGSTLEAINHVVLTAWTYKIIYLDDETAKELGLGLIPFGQTITHLSLCVFLLFVFEQVIKLFDADTHHIKNESKLHLKENEILRESLALSNQIISTVIGSIGELGELNLPLERHLDRITALRIEHEKLDAKFLSKQKSSETESGASEEPDLFKSTPRKNKMNGSSPAKRRRKPPPKF